MARPELIAPPELFYDDKESRKYATNSRMMNIQTAMAERCLELLNLPASSPKFLLDIGCGSGLSGAVLSEARHMWVGLDISSDMLHVASERGTEGDLMAGDMGQGFGFRAGSFDGAISVSALQWLCYSVRKDHVSWKRVTTFFHCLYRSLKRGARAVLQFYPETKEQMEMITTTAMRCGFSGGVVVDFPNSTKAKKVFLVITAGHGVTTTLPKGKMDEATKRVFEKHRKSGLKKKNFGRASVKSKEWIKMKKDQARRKGDKVKRDSRFTGRKRPDRLV